ncbi:unnamed protein product [Miscanthus lutarioriparius]|uniref:Uncharacterized protein n=1 Tax=Miscanthus lutarioriparius TaxID=422564 RepID=A0A811S177_9POAL|nr:unnamed protein product [Miscanthus lutarioriparius]
MAAGCNCKAAIGCVDARAPVRASYVSLYKWPESDAEFVKSVAMARRQGGGGGGGQESPAGRAAGASASYYYYGHYNGSGSMRNNSGELLAPAGYCSPRVVDSYSCRQMYLRSYTFSKRKETVPERTMACLGRVRERGAAVFPLFLPQRNGGSSTDAASVGSASNRVAVARGESRDDREDDDVLGLRGSSSNQQQGRKQSRRRRRKKKKKKGCAVVRRMHEASCGAVRAIFRRLLACTTSVDVADGAGAPPQP